jgi:hypothetical protein
VTVRMDVDPVENYSGGKVFWKTHVKAADRECFVFIRSVGDSCIWSNRQTGPLLQALTHGHCKRLSRLSNSGYANRLSIGFRPKGRSLRPSLVCTVCADIEIIGDRHETTKRIQFRNTEWLL